MFLVDDLLLAPVHGLFWVVRKVHDAAQGEIAGEADAITAELSELYMMLETGRITEADFEARERLLLDRLDAVRSRGADTGEGDPDTRDADEGVEES